MGSKNDTEKTKEWSCRINTLQIDLISTKHEYISVSVKWDWEGTKEPHRLWSTVSCKVISNIKMEGFSAEKESFPFAVRKT